MPKWCINKLEIMGSEDEIEKIRGELRGENGRVDFTKIIPIPDNLAGKNLTKAQKEENKNNYGYSDWYGFCCKEWGTKWNASNISEEGDLKFQTAWDAPLPIVKKLSENHPRSSFRIKYVGEGGKDFVGYSDFIGGGECKCVLKIDSDEGRCLSAELLGEDECDEEELDEITKTSPSGNIKTKRVSKKLQKVLGGVNHPPPIPSFICKERFTKEMMDLLDENFGNVDIYEQALHSMDK